MLRRYENGWLVRGHFVILDSNPRVAYDLERLPLPNAVIIRKSLGAHVVDYKEDVELSILKEQL